MERTARRNDTSEAGDHGRPSIEEWNRIADSLGWSEREGHVVRLIAGGKSRRETAADLAISTSTVQTHLQRALWKAHCDDVIDLIWRVVELRDSLRSQ